MSQSYYQQVWKNTQNCLKENLSFESRIRKKGPFQDLNAAKWLIGHLFINYVRVVNELDRCYDQLIHPQKREVIGRLLDLTLGRVLELKEDIVRIEYDDYCFFDNVLIELKLTHQDLEIQIPRYFWKDKEKAMEQRRKWMTQVFDEAEREKFKENFLKNIPDEGKEEAWAKLLAKEEAERAEKEKLEQQLRILGDRGKELSSLEKLLKDVNEPEAKDNDEELDAILLIQRHERARQGRIRATWEAKYRRLKEQGLFRVKIPDDLGKKSATVIQKHWRRYRQRVRSDKHYEHMLELLGLAESSYRDETKLKRISKTEKVQRKLQERNQKEYEEALDVIKSKVTALYSDQMEEDTIDEIRNWFQWYFDVSGCLPDFPPEQLVIPRGDVFGIPKSLGPDFVEKSLPHLKGTGDVTTPRQPLGLALAGLSAIGGSALVSANHWLEPRDYMICQKELEKLKNEAKDGKKGKEKEPLKNKNEKKEPKKKGAVVEFEMNTSNFEVPLKKADRDYRTMWLDMDESKNYDQKYIYDMVKDEKCWELSMEIRRAVDELMRLELEVLKSALERDKNPKKKQKKKSPKAKKEKKKKEKKDPTGHRTIDDLFMELFRNGIIKDYDQAHMKDYIGDKSYFAYEMRQRLMNGPPSMGDVRDLIIQMCILPLGSARIHQLGPLIKSVCLLGSENSGKEFLARIICTETAAVMFDLTPENVAGKYPGKDGLKTLQHLIEKMARVLQPSVIFVDGAEKTFYKKVPKEMKELDPKRMGGLIQKIVKGIKPTDQILLVGVCSEPWLANKKKLLKTYQKLIQVPQMDYGSYMKLWQMLLTPYHSIPRNFDISCLARASKGYSAKAIMDVVSNLFTIQRISKSSFSPYKPIEFLEELLQSKPVGDDVIEKCRKFYEGTDLPKKRANMLAKLKEEIEKAKKKS